MKNLRQRVDTIDLRSASFKAAPEKIWHDLHARGPVVTTRISLLGRVALTTRHAESSIVLRDTDRFTVDAKQVGHSQSAGMRWWVPASLKPLANNLLTLDGEEHRALRQRVDYAFRRTRLDQLRPFIDQIAKQRIADLVHQIEQHGHADFVATVARPMPQQVISRLLGFQTQHSKADNDLDASLLRLGSIRHALDLFRALPAIRTITRKLREEINVRRNDPRQDLLSELIAISGEGRALTEDELLAMVFLLYVAGHETTTHLMSLSLFTLLNGTVSNLERHLPLDIKSASELLRYTSPVQMTKPRFAMYDQQLGNAYIRRGETVAALIGAVNRDEHWIPNPHILDLDRTQVRHLGFGTGTHICLGMHLALQEACIVVNTLFDYFPDIALHPSTDILWSKRVGLRAIDSMQLVKLTSQ